MYNIPTYGHVNREGCAYCRRKLSFGISLCAFFLLGSTGETIAILSYTFDLN